MKLSGIVAPLALAGAASAAAIPQTEIQPDLSKLSTNLKSDASEIDIAVSKRGMADKATDMASTGAAKGITTPINTVVATGSKTLDNVVGNLNGHQLPLGSLETVLKGVFAKVQSGELTPEMIVGALSPSGVQGLLGGVLGGSALGNLETIIKNVVGKVQSNQLTPEMVLGALNPSGLQSILGGVLSSVLGGGALGGSFLGNIETIVKGVVGKIQSGELTPEMIMGALSPSGVQGLLGGVLGGGAIGNLETIVKGIVGKFQSSELTPEMVLGALNPWALQSILGGVLSGVLGNLL
ncbi:hypothetical protein PHISP_00855 [Aspergillus sp. HF37]|nr:hypothetical protein PHISP_00855 [Aspergillus sp. HF37]